MVALALALVVDAGCRQPPPVEHTELPPDPVDAPLDNERYTILEMATAHGAFTIDLEVDAGADTQTIARQLIEPMRDDYAEVLVYFYDRAGDGELPMRRVQWTPEAGYTEIDY